MANYELIFYRIDQLYIFMGKIKYQKSEFFIRDKYQGSMKQPNSLVLQSKFQVLFKSRSKSFVMPTKSKRLFFGLGLPLKSLVINDLLLQVNDLLTPALSLDQVSKKGTNKRLMYSGPNWHTDTGKYCQNLKTLGNSDF